MYSAQIFNFVYFCKNKNEKIIIVFIYWNMRRLGPFVFGCCDFNIYFDDEWMSLLTLTSLSLFLPEVQFNYSYFTSSWFLQPWFVSWTWWIFLWFSPPGILLSPGYEVSLCVDHFLFHDRDVSSTHWWTGGGLLTSSYSWSSELI